MAVESVGDIDPYASQRALIKLKQKNRQTAKVLAAIRQSSPRTDNRPALPGYLKKSISAAAGVKQDEIDTKVTNPRRTINKIVSKYL